MASGPGHYKEAEYLLAMSIEQRAALLSGDPTAGDAQEPDRIVALAQVHATLALAAATGLRGVQNHGQPGETLDYADWMEATQ